MMFAFKRISAAFILASFLAIALFSFVSMLHGSERQMIGDCPFSAAGVSLCPQGALDAALHYIFAYHAFLNVPLKSGLTPALISLLFGVFVAFIFSRRSVFLWSPAPVRFSDSPLVTSYGRKTLRWLSLFENSPPSY